MDLDPKTSTRIESPALHENFFIVAIGASAGGLDALETFFENTEYHSNIAYVVIQHLSPHYKSMMPDLLRRKTALPIQIIEAGDTVEPGRIYLNPPRSILHLKNGKFSFQDVTEENKTAFFPIDGFFQSIAVEYGSKAIGIVLSGTGSDGLSGSRAVKEADGLVLVQSIRQAQFPSMPRNIILAGIADFELSVEDIPSKLQHYISQPENIENMKPDLAEPPDELIDILNMLKSLSGVDFYLYNYETIWRRLRRRIHLTGVNSIQEYAALIHRSPQEIQLLLNEFCLSVSHFFRDNQEWGFLEENILPTMFEQVKENTLRIWIPGCATGEEAYSIAILCHEYLQKIQSDIRIKIFATDIHPDAIRKASVGFFTESALADLSARRLAMYFSKVQEGFKVNSNIREMIVFTRHDLLQDPPFSRMDLIICRNLLVYFQSNIQKKIQAIFNYSLNNKSYLMIGTNEVLVDNDHVFIQKSRKHKVYQSVYDRSAGGSPDIMYSGPEVKEDFYTISTSRWKSKTGAEKAFNNRIVDLTNQMLLEEMASSCMIINQDFQLLKYYGNADKYLKIPEMPESWNILKMVPPDIAAALTVAVKQPHEPGKSVVYSDILFETNEKVLNTQITIRPTAGESPKDKLFMILIRVQSTGENEETTLEADKNMYQARIELLQQELRITRENLHATIEQLQTSNEELTASNEELQGTNEELQSVNEELYTINTEHQQTIEELSSLNHDMNNLLKYSRIGVMFLDESLKIRRFNHKIADEVHITESDIGRPIYHFSHSFSNFNLGEMVSQVLETRETIDDQIISQTGRWYQIHLFPYFDNQNRLLGVLVTIVDISELKDTDRLKHLTREYKNTTVSLGEIQKENQALANKLQHQSLIWTALLKSARLAIVTIDTNGKFLSFASGLADLQPGSGKGTTKELSEILPPDVLHQTIENIDAVIDSDSPISFPFSIKSKAGINTYEGILTKIGPTELALVIRNRNQLFSLEKQLSHARQTLQLLAHNIPDTSVLLFDEKLVFYYAEGFIPAEEVMGKTFLDIYPAHIAKLLSSIFRQTLKGQISEKEFNIGSETFFAKFVPIPSPNSTHGMMIVQLITDKKRVNMELKERIKEMELFAYSVSHDLKTPLRSIISFAQIVHQDHAGELPKDSVSHLDFIIKYAQSMGEMIGGLVNFARLGYQDEALEDVNLSELMNDLKGQMSGLLQEKNATITFDSLPVVKAVHSHMLQLFQNLIENGIKFNQHKNKEIEISASLDNEMYLISVKDNGIGIDKEYGGQIFEVFKRLHSSRTYQGSGIGLATCRRIVQRMGGKIWFDSQPGAGTTFFFTLPLTPMEV
ncbi:MAG: CheR family methyltransferase [Bacteroidia bacterium]